MKWKNSDLRKLFIWILTFFEEYQGKASTKRFIAWVLTFSCADAIFQTIRTVPIKEWNDSIYFLITIFGMIASLIAISYIPTRNSDITGNGK